MSLFVSHHWGDGNEEDKQVYRIVQYLLAKDFTVLFADGKLELALVKNKIDESRLVLVCLTRNYMDKVNKQGNNCQIEFDYAMDTNRECLLVVMEKKMMNQADWKGKFKIRMGISPVVMVTYSEGEDTLVLTIRDRLNQSEDMGILVSAIDRQDARAIRHGLMSSYYPALILVLTTLAYITDNSYCSRLEKYGVFNALTPIIDKYGSINWEVAKWGLCAIKRHLVRIQPIDGTTIMRLLTLQGSFHSEVAEIGCELIASLTQKEKFNKAVFGNLGACEAVIGVLRKWGETHQGVTKFGLGAICNLADLDFNQARLSGLGACEVVMGIFHKWGESHLEIAQTGCGAICNLASNNDANKVKLGKLGACEAVVGALRTWGQIDGVVAEYGCAAICNLVTNHLARLEKLNVHEVLATLPQDTPHLDIAKQHLA